VTTMHLRAEISCHQKALRYRLMMLACCWSLAVPCLVQDVLGQDRTQSPVKAKSAMEVLYPATAQGNIVASNSEAQRSLGPLRLIRPLSVEAIERLYGEADGHYQGRAQRQAHEALMQLLELAPDYLPGWLRLGNLLQQRQDITLASRAYRRCVELSRAQGSQAAEFGHKALFNLASISLQRAQEAVHELEAWQSSHEPHPIANAGKPSSGQLPSDASSQELKPVVELLTNRWQELSGAPEIKPVQIAANEAEVNASPKVPVYQGWAKRRQPGPRQLALPPEDEPKKGQAASKPVMRPGEGLQAAQPKIQELRTTPESSSAQAAASRLPEVIYLNGKPGASAKASR
jgi:tetratricopeptide (TPR) repeat protein